MTHIYYTQYHNQLPIVNAVSNVNLKNGKVVSYGQILYKEQKNSQLVLNSMENVPEISPMDAVESFLEFLKFDTIELSQSPIDLQDLNQIYTIHGVLKKDVPVTLKYLLEEDKTLSLVWDMGKSLLN